MRRAATLVLTLAAAAGAATGQQSPFPVGERLQYEVVWGFLRLGTAEMRVVGIDTIRGKPAAHIRFRILGNHYLYRMDNSMDSWIALADTASLRFHQDRNENGKKSNDYYEIFPDSGYYRQVDVDSLRDRPQPASPRPLDDAAFFYFVRTAALEPGQRYEFNRYFRPDRNPVILDSLVVDTLDVPAGRFPSLKLKPVIKGRGILGEVSEARMWLSHDDRRILVQLKSKFPYVGYLTLRLVAQGTDAPRAESGTR